MSVLFRLHGTGACTWSLELTHISFDEAYNQKCSLLEGYGIYFLYFNRFLKICLALKKSLKLFNFF
jgi:hypothetical protein